MIINEQSILTQEIKEVKEFESKYKVMYADLSKIQIRTNSKIMESLEMRFADKVFTSVLDDGFRNYCSLLRIPVSYALHEIPHDLLIKSVQRLREWGKKKDKKVLIVYYGNVLVNVVDASKWNTLPKPSKLLSQLAESGIKLDGGLIRPIDDNGKINKLSNFKHCYIGDKGATVDIIIPGYETVLEVLGEKIGFGLRITDPFTGFGSKLRIEAFLHQWCCSNGMMVGSKFISEELSTGLAKYGLDTYLDHLMKNKINFDKIQKTLVGMSKTKIEFKYLKVIWNKLRKINATVFEKVFELRDQNRYEYYKNRLMTPSMESENAPLTYFEVMYSMTEQSQHLGGKAPRKQQELEAFSNKMIELYKIQIGEILLKK